MEHPAAHLAKFDKLFKTAQLGAQAHLNEEGRKTLVSLHMFQYHSLVTVRARDLYLSLGPVLQKSAFMRTMLVELVHSWVKKLG